MPGFQFFSTYFSLLLCAFWKFYLTLKNCSVFAELNSLPQDEAKCFTPFKNDLDVHLHIHVSNFKFACPGCSNSSSDKAISKWFTCSLAHDLYYLLNFKQVSKSLLKFRNSETCWNICQVRNIAMKKPVF